MTTLMASKKSKPAPTEPTEQPPKPSSEARKKMGNAGKPKHRWSNVDKARELFEKRAADYVKVHFETVKKAAESGKEAVALAGAQWAIEHQAVPGEDGKTIRVIAPSIDAERLPEGGARGPQVLISFPFPPGHPALLTAGAQQPAIEGETLPVNQNGGETEPKAQDVKPLQHKGL